jgi:hypothetical protein
MIEKKVSYGAGAGAATGLVVWALISFVPMFHTGVPEPVVAVIPVFLAWLGHTIAAYSAPHTPRNIASQPVTHVDPGQKTS